MVEFFNDERPSAIFDSATFDEISWDHQTFTSGDQSVATPNSKKVPDMFCSSPSSASGDDALSIYKTRNTEARERPSDSQRQRRASFTDICSGGSSASREQRRSNSGRENRRDDPDNNYDNDEAERRPFVSDSGHSRRSLSRHSSMTSGSDHRASERRHSSTRRSTRRASLGATGKSESCVRRRSSQGGGRGGRHEYSRSASLQFLPENIVSTAFIPNPSGAGKVCVVVYHMEEDGDEGSFHDDSKDHSVEMKSPEESPHKSPRHRRSHHPKEPKRSSPLKTSRKSASSSQRSNGSSSTATTKDELDKPDSNHSNASDGSHHHRQHGSSTESPRKCKSSHGPRPEQSPAEGNRTLKERPRRFRAARSASLDEKTSRQVLSRRER